MSDLRLRDDQGRFVSDAEESKCMNAAFMAMCGQQPIAPAPITTANGAGQPIPLTPAPVLTENENVAMNKMMLAFCGICNDSR
jgi:hypothetical protein